MNYTEMFAKTGEGILVDAEDKPFLDRFSWSIKHCGKNKYAASVIFAGGKFHGILMHRLILGLPKEGDVDHANRNGLDNRKENLRRCARAQNVVNSAIRGGKDSKYRGVTYYGRIKNYTNPWIARIGLNNKKIHLGYFSTAELAAKAYDRKAREIHGHFAVLNFPEDPINE